MREALKSQHYANVPVLHIWILYFNFLEFKSISFTNLTYKKGIFVCFLLCNKHHNWEEKQTNKKLG